MATPETSSPGAQRLDLFEKFFTNADAPARIQRLAAYLSRTGLGVEVPAANVQRAAILRGLDILERNPTLPPAPKAAVRITMRVDEKLRERAAALATSTGEVKANVLGHALALGIADLEREASQPA